MRGGHLRFDFHKKKSKCVHLSIAPMKTAKLRKMSSQKITFYVVLWTLPSCHSKSVTLDAPENQEIHIKMLSIVSSWDGGLEYATGSVFSKCIFAYFYIRCNSPYYGDITP